MNNNEENQGDESEGIHIPESMVVVIFSVAAYSMILLYQIGYNAYFQIPTALTDITLTNMITSAKSMLGNAMLPFIIYFAGLGTVISKLRQPSSDLDKFDSSEFIFNGIVCFVTWPYWMANQYPLLISLFWLLIGVSSYRRRKNEFDWQKSTELSEREGKFVAPKHKDPDFGKGMPKGTLFVLLYFLTPKWRLPIFIILTMLLYSYGSGLQSAATQYKFFVNAQDHNQIVISYDQDKLVFVEYDKKTNSTTNKITIKEYSDDITLESVKISGLHVEGAEHSIRDVFTAILDILMPSNIEEPTLLKSPAESQS